MIFNACVWLSSASGCAQAMCNLGNAYAEGRGVPVNDKEAVKYWKMAVSLENEVGQYSLGKAYFFGQQGLTEDTVEGIRLIKLASKNGFEEATDFLSKADGIQKCLLDVIDVLNRPRPSK
jgi:TPR repeat protein